MANLTEHWYLFLVERQKELFVAREMRRRSIHAVVPVARKFRNIGGRYVRGKSGKKEQFYTVAPGYVFICFRLPEGVSTDFIQWYVPLSYRQVYSVVSLDGKPYRLKTSVVNAWLEKENSGVFADTEATKYMPTGHEFSEGDIVEVTARGLDALKGRVQEIDGETSKILTEMFGSEYSVSVPTWALAKAV